MADVIDRLLPSGRQIKTDAHPLVELTVMDQPHRQRTLVHLVSGIGHQDTAYSAGGAEDIRIELARDVPRSRRRARRRPARDELRRLSIDDASEPRRRMKF